jgi:hypothetical protein
VAKEIIDPNININDGNKNARKFIARTFEPSK